MHARRYRQRSRENRV
jgi:hypothetical protein